MRRRLLVVSKEFPPEPGGVADYCTLWIDEVMGDTEDWDVTVLTQPWPGREPSGSTAIVEIERWTPSRVWRVLRSVRPDAVVLHYVPHMYQKQGVPVWFPMLALVARWHTDNLVVLFHEMASNQARLRTRFLLPIQGLIVALSASFAHRSVVTIWPRAQSLGTRIPWVRNRIDVIPISPTLRGIKRGSPEVGGVLRLLHFGSSHPSRDFSLIVDALDRLDSIGVAYELRVVGTAAAPDPRANVLGYCAEDVVTQELFEADIILLPFTDGASGRRSTIANSLAAGRAVVSTAGVDTDVEWYGSALLLAHERSRFPDLVESLAVDEDARKMQGENAYRWAEQNVSWRRTAEQWRAIL
ncbi:glycosyltransferase family 4 protein [Rhodococcus sp. IEGM 1401]|uniref:glycosyltransferase family 4 protein n=1 Tax=unclassified Rhodococcus (in: high G+C Gram-positive bacteria) TaxID=192944 RepID=UPI0022B53BAB|nr:MULTISPECIES: glycosyltransferase family 4 protein [unclassified Rhodococcus (in: high G+C Gram-positive bacteria)]MCZ4560880.1 glycosyltransferase family 4 protein [Rhodococcus sp. IEGM 1401]MDI9921021.1 glycosyltransferase family 4 protein [Rhodococcus sp. IEGM 1372]MDV8033379.1 glycosyltransferase family 4 protein [Rhodococcus sp. IEGM 1414]